MYIICKNSEATAKYNVAKNRTRLKSLIMAFVFCCSTAFGQQVGENYKRYFGEGVQNMLVNDRSNYSYFYDWVVIRDTTFGELSSISALNQDDVRRLQELSKKLINKKSVLQYNINMYGNEIRVVCNNKDVVAYFELSKKIYDNLYDENKRLEKESKQAAEEAAIKKKYDDMRKAEAQQQEEALRQQRLKHLEDSLRIVYEKEKLEKEQKENSKIIENFDEQKIEKCIADYFAEPVSENKYYTGPDLLFLDDYDDVEGIAKEFAKINLQYLRQYISKYNLNREEALKVSSTLYGILQKNDSENLEGAAMDNRKKIYARAQSYVNHNIGQLFPSEPEPTVESQDKTIPTQVAEQEQQIKSKKPIIIGNIEVDDEWVEEWLNTILISFGVIFVVLLLMAMSKKVVVFNGWGDFSLTFALAAITVVVIVYGNVMVGILTGFVGILVSIWLSAKHNSSIILGIIVGTFKLLCAIALIGLLILAYIFASIATDKRREAAHFGKYGRDYKRADAADKEARQMALFQQLCNGLVEAFISKK